MAHGNDAAFELAQQLPPWMPKDPESGNYKLIYAIGKAFERLEEDIEAVDRATTVQHADTIAQLWELAKLVSLTPLEGESKEKYRARVFAEFQLTTNEATPAELIENAANILDVGPENITYDELDEAFVIRLGVPGSAIDSIAITDTEFADIMDRLAAAGARVDSVKLGTFTYITVEDYNDPEFVHNASLAYDQDSDLDGQPDGNGGTYSGLIQ